MLHGWVCQGVVLSRCGTVIKLLFISLSTYQLKGIAIIYSELDFVSNVCFFFVGFKILLF